MKPLALVVEDAPEYARLATTLLTREGFDVRVTESGEQGVQLARQLDPELLLVDVLLPGIDGFEVCRQVRTVSDAYLIMVTGVQDEVEKVVGLRLGADDYVTKPYSPGELSARVAAIRRRPRSRIASEVLADGLLTVDPTTREVRVGEHVIDLTRTEFELLSQLMNAPRLVLSRRQLLDAVWGHTASDPHVVDVHVGNMRRKLRRALKTDEPVVTVRGVGYRYLPGLLPGA